MTTQRNPGLTDDITVSGSFTFSASHELRMLPEGHKCRRNHGHNYTVTVEARVHSGVSGDLSPLGAYLDANFDHYLLNERIPFHPTCELLARHLAEWFEGHIESARLISMVVSETPRTAARCDGLTREITISKTFASDLGDVTLVLGSDDLDEVGFVTDFGDLSPFAEHLRDPAAAERLRRAGPAVASDLAGWFVDVVEPKIRARLRSVRVDSRTAVGSWERGEAA
ncbi:6-pyruvoyl trahydropterin synthase family protein [Lentzea sp. NPDC092896]|uniref:6-pyruvoyl trahydropterin synthase family protein n=1 Tax=Lentzea sp. NPDC092896 TaxID=3364127 RepID=UPI0037FE67F2